MTAAMAVAPTHSHWLDPARLQQQDTLVNTTPFNFFVARQLLPSEAKGPLSSDFPTFKGAGYLPYEAEQCGKSINRLIDDLTAPAFADAIGELLNIERLSQYPTYISISRFLNKRHGTIHTDGKSKIATALLYLNQDWDINSGGCLRFLNRIDDIEDTVVPEISPEFGTLVAFKRADNSFHGHRPFQGERRVIQIAWLVSEEDKLRKGKRGKLSHLFKKLMWKADRKIGAGRDDSASHD